MAAIFPSVEMLGTLWADVWQERMMASTKTKRIPADPLDSIPFIFSIICTRLLIVVDYTL
jgi:hypothetical protein